MFRTSGRALGCAFHGDTTVLERPMEMGMDDNSVKPGLHHPRRGSHTVVWFDPAALDLSEKRSMGLQYEEVLTGSAEAGLEVYRDWQTKQAEIISVRGKPQFEIERATEATLADSRRWNSYVFRSKARGLQDARSESWYMRCCSRLSFRSSRESAGHRRGWRRGFWDPRTATSSRRFGLRWRLQHPLLAGIATATGCIGVSGCAAGGWQVDRRGHRSGLSRSGRRGRSSISRPVPRTRSEIADNWDCTGGRWSWQRACRFGQSCSRFELCDSLQAVE